MRSTWCRIAVASWPVVPEGSALLPQLSQAYVARIIVDHYYPPAGGNDPRS